MSDSKNGICQAMNKWRSVYFDEKPRDCPLIECPPTSFDEAKQKLKEFLDQDNITFGDFLAKVLELKVSCDAIRGNQNAV